MKLTDFIAGGNVSSGLASAYTTLTAGQAVQQGDIITQGADGLAYWANDPALGPGYGNAFLNTATAYNSQYSAMTAYGGGSILGCSSATLSNGNIVLAFNQGGTAFFTVFSPAGAVVVPTTQIGTGVISSYYIFEMAQISVIALSAGGFAVAYTTSSGSMLAIYSNTGAVVSAVTSVLTNGASGGYSTGKGNTSICQISNGNIVVCLGALGSTGFMYFCTLTAAGVAVLPATAVNASAFTTTSNPPAIAVAPCGTGFVLVYGVYAGGGTLLGTGYSQSFTSAGATLSGVVSQNLGTAGSTTSNAPGVVAVGVAGGGAFTGLFSGENLGAVINAYMQAVPSNGTVGGWVTLTTATTATSMALTLDASFNCMVAMGCSAGFYVAKMLNTGSLSATPSLTSLGSPVQGIANATLSDGSYAVVLSSGSAYRFVNLTAVNTPGTISNIVNSTNFNPSILAVTSSAINGAVSGGPYWFTFGNNGYAICCTTLQTCVPVGVATAAIPAGSAVTVQTLGAAQTRLIFQKPYAINARQYSGQQMSVVGNLAMMNGIQGAGSLRNID